MRHKAMAGWILAAIWLVLAGPGSPAEAALGCFREGDFSAATCTVAADCIGVGGVDCTSGVCFCPGSPTDPVCPCGPAQAPALSPSGSVSAVALIAAIGLLGLWRAARRRREQS